MAEKHRVYDDAGYVNDLGSQLDHEFNQLINQWFDEKIKQGINPRELGWLMHDGIQDVMLTHLAGWNKTVYDNRGT